MVVSESICRSIVASSVSYHSYCQGFTGSNVGGGDLGARKRVAKCLATPTFVDYIMLNLTHHSRSTL